MCEQCHKLEASWTGVPATLARNKRLFNIVSQNKELLEKLSTMAQRDIDNVVRTWQRDPELMMQVLQTLTGKPLLTADKNAELLNKFKDNIGQAYRFGLDTAPGSPQLIPRMIEESVKDNVFKFVTRLDDDTRKELGTKLSDILEHNRTAPFEEKLMPRQVAQELSKTLDGNVARAEAIARTETMRAANLASWSQAKAMGATHYAVDSSFEACDECSDVYDGEIFPVDDVENLPPLHPNCACVPAFGTEEEAQEMADELSQRNEDEVSDLAELGMEPASDGSGPVEITEDTTPEPVSEEPQAPKEPLSDEEIWAKENGLDYVGTEQDIANGIAQETRDSHIFYDKENNTYISIPKDIDLNKVALSPEEFLKNYSDAPQVLKEEVKNIFYTDKTSLETLGQTRGANLTIFGSHPEFISGGSSINNTLNHELAHVFENSLKTELGKQGNVMFSDIQGQLWREASKADGGATKMSSDYAQSFYSRTKSYKEDFADAFKAYNMNEGQTIKTPLGELSKTEWVQNYPNRANVIDELMSNPAEYKHGRFGAYSPRGL